MNPETVTTVKKGFLSAVFHESTVCDRDDIP